MKAARISETLLNFYQTTWHYNPEDSHLHTHHRENLKSNQGINLGCCAKILTHYTPDEGWKHVGLMQMKQTAAFQF
jgi:hypothetical protein